MPPPSYILEADASEETMKAVFKKIHEKDYSKEEDEEELKSMMDYGDKLEKVKNAGNGLDLFKMEVNLSLFSL